MDYRDQQQLRGHSGELYHDNFLGARAFTWYLGTTEDAQLVVFDAYTDLMVQVVNEGSARLNKPNEVVIGLTANHLTMCKFETKNDLYSKVLRRLRAEVAMIGTMVGDQEHERHVKNLFESVSNVSDLLVTEV